MGFPEFIQETRLPLWEKIKLSARPALSRWARPGVTLVFTTAMAVINFMGDVAGMQVLIAVVFTVGLHAGLGFTALGASRVAGLWQQQMTWDIYRDHTWAPDEAEMAAEAEQMRHVDDRVQKFAADQGMEQITLAVSGAQLGSWDAAGSIRSSKTHGHIELGHLWFFSEGRSCLPHIVEHELAHLERNDSRSSVIEAAAGAGLIVACAGLLPLLHAAVVVVGVIAVRTAWSWWVELACDTAAARRCGRAASVTALSQLLEADRGLPLAARLCQLPSALRTHPPLRLRRWWIRTAPWAQAR